MEFYAKLNARPGGIRVPEHPRQSALRYPLTAILGSVAKVETLRELARHGGELSAPSLIARTGLSKASVRHALKSLEGTAVVQEIGSGRSRLYRLRREHPLASGLDSLFQQEEERFEAILNAVRAAAGRCRGLLAVWLYGSVARGQDLAASDVDVAVVGEPASLPQIEQAMHAALGRAGRKLAFNASVVAVGSEDVLRLDVQNDRWWSSVVRDALPVVGERPEALLARLKDRQETRRRAAS